MSYIDISLPLHNQTVTWPGENLSIETQPPSTDGIVVSRLNLWSHTGTHIDAPAHMIPNTKTVDQIPWEKLIGPCQIFTIKSAAPEITLSDFNYKKVIPRSRILFKTKNSKLLEAGKFKEDYTCLSVDVARFLADREIWLVGIDYLSIEAYNSPNYPVHKMLLEKEIVILEGLYLEHVPKGEYELYCLPLSLYQADGAPCRAMLKEANS